MSAHFDLIIAADSTHRTAEFRLCDESGAHLAFQHTDFNTISSNRLQGLFDLRNYLRLYAEKGSESTAIAEIGICIAEDVLGPQIFETLWRPQSPRTLRIRLPGATEQDNLLAAALARVPWEIARPSAKHDTLGERNLLVRVVHDTQAPASQPLALKPDESLRVLFVFAEARGARPLGARQERRDLLRMLEKEVYPYSRVVAHFLSHGVTRERLRDQIVDNGGYHVVHWSGHGQLNLLELSRPGGDKDHLSGKDLLDLFTDAGGFLPRLFFLSACHSGDLLRVRDWNDFMAIAQGKEPNAKAASAETRTLDLQEQPGFTGTAHALLQGGVPSVVAMRYAVGDDYARELAVEFYRAMLAHAAPKPAAAALNLARQAMRDTTKHNAAQFAVCDHATPVLYGEEDPRLALAKGRSPALNPRNPRLHRIVELSTAGHEHFVGRTWELAGLGADFIGSSRGTEIRPVAVITGLGGMGKTALVAEALALWESRFEWVLLYQAKPNPLVFDGFLRDTHLKLMGELGSYHNHVKARPADALYRDPDESFTGAARLERLTLNLVRALTDEPILLVLDNFETNLKPLREGDTAGACQDPAWDQCLALLARELVGTASRVLITCRRPLAAFGEGTVCAVPLGPLPSSEAALYLKAQPALSRMIFGNDADERTLAMRLLNASRFHPLLMDRLARLAADVALRPQLLQALDTLETTKDFAQLPALFAARSGNETELAYLSDALTASLDQLIRDAGADARRLLWMIAVANESVALGLLESVWSGESYEQQRLRQLKQMLDVAPSLPAELQEMLNAMPAKMREALDALPPAPPLQPEIAPLLRQLVSVGLITEERDGPDDDNPELSCHELVRERICAWMDQRPEARGDLSENSIRLAYAERFEVAFKALQHQDMTAAVQAGSYALVYCVQAEAWGRLGSFASSLITSTMDPRLLGALLPHLQTAAEASPEGRARWSSLCYLADALNQTGQKDLSLSLYEQAATLAQTGAEAGGDGARQAWSDLANITGNWALAIQDTGTLDAARERQLASADAHKNAMNPEINVIGCELEALRIDIMQGEVEAALPQVELRLAQVQAWWEQHHAGQVVPEAPNAEFLVRALLCALDIAFQAAVACNDWDSALSRLDATLDLKHVLMRTAEDIGATRVNRATVLVRLPGREAEAKAELEACFTLFQNQPDILAKVLDSLASLFATQNDLDRAITQKRRALALFEQLPAPIDRASSHGNLAHYLGLGGKPADLSESSRHRLAALLYHLAIGHEQHLETSFHGYAIDFRRAHTTGTEFAVPRVADLLANPAFAALEHLLRQRQIDPDELQAKVDAFLDHARQIALSSENSP